MNQCFIVLKKDMEIKLEYCKEEMQKEESNREPPKPMMKGSKANLPLHKDVEVVLFNCRSNYQKYKKYATENSRPPNEIVTEKRCCNLSSHIYENTTQVKRSQTGNNKQNVVE